MRRTWLSMGTMLVLICIAFLSLGCQPAEEVPAPTYLDPYRPAIKDPSAEDEAAWELLPRYTISATLSLDPLEIAGTQRIQFMNRSPGPLQEIVLRLYPNLELHRARLVVKSISAKGRALEFEEDGSGTAIIIPCDPPLEPGQIAALDMRFSATIPDRESGWTLFGRSQDIISLPFFYPILAVHDAKGWHREVAPPYADASFAESSFYQVFLTTPAEMVLAHTGVGVSQTAPADGMVTHEIVAGPIREFVVLASPRLQIEEMEAYGTVVKSYFMEEDREAGMSALWRAASALRVYSDYFYPYPFSEMTVAQAPLTFRGMEFSGLNLIGIDTYRGNRKELDYLVIHEVAHQWWYNLIGNNPVTCPWLDEGLAEYSAYTYYLKIYGRERADALRDIRWLAAYEYAKAHGMDTVLSQPAGAFGDSRLYETIVYAKSALFFDVLRRTVGDDVFYAILHEYLKQYRFQNVEPEAFFALAQQISGRNLIPLIQEWVLSSQ